MQDHLRGFHRVGGAGERWVHTCSFLLFRDLHLDRRRVGEHELELEHRQRRQGVALAAHLVIGEAAQHEAECVDFTDPSKKAVAESLAAFCTGDEPRDVDDLDRRLDDLATSTHLRQRVQPVVGNVRYADRGLGRRERMGRHRDVPTGEHVEQQRLAGVRQTDKTDALHLGSRLPGSQVHFAAVSKRTVKRKLRKKKNANHGKKPNCGRG